MRPKLWLVLFFAIPLFAQMARKSPLSIVVDDWWNIDYVKSSCQMYAQAAAPCTRTPEETVRQFENELEGAFATESACHGVTFLHFTPEMVQAAVKNPAAPATGVALETANAHWQLMLDLDGHSKNQVGQEWTISNLATKMELNGHITTSARLALQVCKIAKGVGGTAK